MNNERAASAKEQDVLGTPTKLPTIYTAMSETAYISQPGAPAGLTTPRRERFAIKCLEAALSLPYRQYPKVL